jgi:ankyrin repeat protein
MRALMSILDEEEGRDGRQHVKLLQLLLDAGADPNGANGRYGTTPLLKVAEMKKKNALFAAKLLIEAGSCVNVADDAGQTALMHAAFPPFDHEMFLLLVEAGADTESRRNDGCTGLVNAAAGGETDAARAWIEAGADINATGPNGNTPLMLAAQGWPNIVEALLTAGADVTAADADGDTALHFAVVGYRWSTEQDKSVIMRRLLEAGGNARARNRKGHTALTDLLHLEREQQIEAEVMREFRSEPHGSEPDITTTVQYDSELCRLLRDAGCEP